MPDRKKVIKGLEICAEHGAWHGLFCDLNEAYKNCPYRGCETGCVVTIAKDALALLKEQEPRLLTIEEITGGGECWFEGINGDCGYADCYMWPASKEVEVNRISRELEYVSLNNFMKKWRCWTFKPTYEQSKAVKWDE